MCHPGVGTSTFLQPGKLWEGFVNCVLIVVKTGQEIPAPLQRSLISWKSHSWGRGQCKHGDKGNFGSLMLKVSSGKSRKVLWKSSATAIPWEKSGNKIQAIFAKLWSQACPRISQFLGWFSHPSTAFPSSPLSAPLYRDTDAKNVMQDIKKIHFLWPSF